VAPGFRKRSCANEHDPEKWHPVFGKDHAQMSMIAKSGTRFSEKIMRKDRSRSQNTQTTHSPTKQSGVTALSLAAKSRTFFQALSAFQGFIALPHVAPAVTRNRRYREDFRRTLGPQRAIGSEDAVDRHGGIGLRRGRCGRWGCFAGASGG
jgi:hypothetical protein